MSSHHLGQYKGKFYSMDEFRIANLLPIKAPVYTDTFSNRSVFISLHFQIVPLWFAYSNVCVFIIVFIIYT